MTRYPHRFTGSLALAAAIALLAAGPAAQTAVPGQGSAVRLLGTDTFLEMESVGAPAIAPDGRQIVFARTWIDKMKEFFDG